MSTPLDPQTVTALNCAVDKLKIIFGKSTFPLTVLRGIVIIAIDELEWEKENGCNGCKE